MDFAEWRSRNLSLHVRGLYDRRGSRRFSILELNASAMGQKKLSIFVGNRFGNATVLCEDRSAGRLRLGCRCDCGREFLALPTRLNAGSTTSCGPCKKKSNAQVKVVDMVGQTFGRLRALSRAPSNEKGNAQWLCQCECGSSPIIITGKRLRNKADGTKSCGCLAKESSRSRLIDLKGKSFGRLTVKSYVGKDTWDCVCDCGSLVEKKGQPLREIRTTFHCGSDICSADEDFFGPPLPLSIAKQRGMKLYSPGLHCSKGHRGLYLVSTMGCVTCHRKRTIQFVKKNPELTRQYQRDSRAKPVRKLQRNRKLKVRREADFVFRYVDRLRSRVGRVLRTINFEKVEAFDRNSALARAIAEAPAAKGYHRLISTPASMSLIT